MPYWNCGGLALFNPPSHALSRPTRSHTKSVTQPMDALYRQARTIAVTFWQQSP